jgi:predicted transcriptional regulator
MTTGWRKFHKKQMEDPKLRALVERETEELQMVVQIHEGLRAANEGKFVSHAEVKRMIARMRRS